MTLECGALYLGLLIIPQEKPDKDGCLSNYSWTLACVSLSEQYSIPGLHEPLDLYILYFCL